jgi:hypothetical protein
MKVVELTGNTSLNHEELDGILEKAIGAMISANESYSALKQLADNTPYNESVIDALKNFNYDGFRKDKGLRIEVFERAKKFLVKGDIRGMYGATLADTAKILFMLNQLKAQVEAGEFPSLDTVWSLNQLYGDAQLFGQYVAQVFYALN